MGAPWDIGSTDPAVAGSCTQSGRTNSIRIPAGRHALLYSHAGAPTHDRHRDASAAHSPNPPAECPSLPAARGSPSPSVQRDERALPFESGEPRLPPWGRTRPGDLYPGTSRYPQGSVPSGAQSDR